MEFCRELNTWLMVVLVISCFAHLIQWSRCSYYKELSEDLHAKMVEPEEGE